MPERATINHTLIERQLPFTLGALEFPALGSEFPKYEGKVRDSYVTGNRRILVTSDRLSAFDRVLTTIPFKGQVLNALASYWFRETAHLVPNHVISEPHPNIFVTQQATVLPIEVVVRGYLAGSGWRDYEAGRAVSGIELPKGLRRSHRFDTPIITPSTKAEKGHHDEPISSEEVVRRGIVEKRLWEEVCEAAMTLFRFGTERAARQGLILVDTKYEFGTVVDPNGNRQLLIVDEIHTPDSSRYWVAESYANAYAQGEDPAMLDKEFVRRWLIERGYMGDGTPPQFPDSFRIEVAERYIELCERVTGSSFQPTPGPQLEAIERVLIEVLRG